MNMNCTSCDTAFEASQAALDCPSCGSEVPVPLRRRTAVVAAPPGKIRDDIAGALGELGFHLVIYPSGTDVFDELLRIQPDLAVLSVVLDGEMGVTLCERARRERALDGTRFVLLGAIFRADRFRAKPRSTYGADAYLEEPVTPGELRAILDRVFSVDAPDRRRDQP